MTPGIRPAGVMRPIGVISWTWSPVRAASSLAFSAPISRPSTSGWSAGFSSCVSTSGTGSGSGAASGCAGASLPAARSLPISTSGSSQPSSSSPIETTPNGLRGMVGIAAAGEVGTAMGFAASGFSGLAAGSAPFLRSAGISTSGSSQPSSGSSSTSWGLSSGTCPSAPVT
ncbi:hypothetical protein [Nannocystis pusilla]|uniref:hypothetical protein n=1 Tax=Nannocystis pusilla TaxID=889268 RepID=UPI003DA2AE30